MKKIFFLIAVTIIAIAPGIRAQKITRINPANITLRAISACGFSNVITVGDSATILINKGNIDSLRAPIWSQIDAKIDRSINLMAVSYIDPYHGIIGGTNGTIASTTDAGVTWQHADIGTTATIRSLANNGNGVVIGVGDSGIIIRSTDSGVTWSRLGSVAQAQLNGVTFGTANAGTIVGNDSIILRTSDSGQTWIPFNNPYDLSALSSYLDSGIDYAAVAMNGADSIWVTLRWPILLMRFINGDTDASIKLGSGLIPNSGPATSMVYAPFPNYDAAVFSTDDHINIHRPGGTINGEPLSRTGDADGGQDASTIRIFGASCYHQGGAGSGGTTLAYLCGENATIDLSYAVGQIGFLQSPLSTSGLLFFLSTSFAASTGSGGNSTNTGYAVGTGGDVRRTTDGGLSWHPLASPGYYDIYNDTLNTIYALDTNTAIAIGWKGQILRTSNAGANWDTIPTGVVFKLHGIAFPTPAIGIIVGDNGSFFRSIDSGKTWSSDGISIDKPTILYMSAVDFTSAATGVATGDSGTIFRTTDAGLHWTSINNLESGSENLIRQVQAFPNDTIYARAGSDFLVSYNAGLNWQQVNTLFGGDTLGFGFYNARIGIVGQYTTTTALVPDTAFFRYTTDGCTTWSNQFAVPIWNYNRILFHWLNDHQVLLYGIQGFTVLVDISTSGVQMTRLDSSQEFQVYPNPSSGEISVDYTSKTSGPVAIDLCDETGRTVKTLFTGEEAAGGHEHSLDISKEAHGAYLVRLTHDGKASVAPVSEE